MAYIVTSDRPLASLKELDLERARAYPGVAAVLSAADVPGINDASAFAHDEPLLAARRAPVPHQPRNLSW